MKSKMLTFFLVAITVFATGCKGTKVDLDHGVGSITYEGVEHTLNFSTAITYLTATDGIYSHNITFTDTNNGDVAFSFSVKDDNSGKGITAGNYTTTLNGDYTAHFSIGDIGDSLAGTMIVTVSGDNYTFNFSGTTIDENTEIKTVKFTYSGKIANS